jgi:branched-chain amino acid transport system permease protein
MASLIMMNLRLAAFGFLRKIWVSYVGLAVTALALLLGAAVMIEMVYHLQLNAAMGSTLKFIGITFDAHSLDHWFGSVFVMLTGLGLFELCRRQYVQEWGVIQEDIEKEIKRREAL